MHEGAVSARLGMAGIPSLSESTMVARDGALALYEDARVHFQHLSCVESVQALAAAKAAGARVSGEVCPHHLTLTDDMVRTLDSRFKMNPPLRTETDRRALVEALRTGVIDCVATDHAPHARHEKEVPFEEAPMGTTGLETAFAALFTELVMAGTLELATVVERMTAGGELYGLPAPRIAVGEPANLCLIDLDARFQVGEDGYASRSGNCCFHGRTLHGRVVHDRRRRAGRLPPADAGHARGGSRRRPSRRRTRPPMSRRRHRLRPARGRDALRRARLRRRRPGGGGDRVHDVDVRLPGGDDRPQLRRPADRLHYPQIGNYGVSAEAMESDRVHARAAIMRAAVDRADAPGAEAGWLELADRAGHPGHHRRRHARAGSPHP